MPDFFVDPSGSDSADGSSGRPFRSITRATVAAVSAGGTGDLRVANGVYDRGSGEDFPISVPPGYVLRGASRTNTRIHYSLPSSGNRGFVAIEAGSGVRTLTLRAGPPGPGGPGATCSTGIRVTINDCRIENVRILSSRDLPNPRPYEFEDWPADLGTFWNALSATTVLRTEIVDCLVEWYQMSWLAGGSVVRGCTFDDAPLMVDGATVSASTFLAPGPHSGIFQTVWCGINSQNRVSNNTFRGRHGVMLDGTNFPVRDSVGPTIDSNLFDRCSHVLGDQGDGATGLFTGNRILNPIGHTNVHLDSRGGGTRVVDNIFSTDSLESPLRFVYTAGLARPSFEGNTFREPFYPFELPPPYPPRIQIDSSADLGGGGASSGGNDFSELNRILCSGPATEVFLQSNIWRTSPPPIWRTTADAPAQIFAFNDAIVRL